MNGLVFCTNKTLHYTSLILEDIVDVFTFSSTTSSEDIVIEVLYQFVRADPLHMVYDRIVPRKSLSLVFDILDVMISQPEPQFRYALDFRLLSDKVSYLTNAVHQRVVDSCNSCDNIAHNFFRLYLLGVPSC